MLHFIISVAAAATSTGTVSLTATADVGGDLSTRGDTIVLTRAGAVRRAMEVNPQVAAQRASEYEARARLGQVDAAKHPRINALFSITTAVAADNTDADENGV